MSRFVLVCLLFACTLLVQANDYNVVYQADGDERHRLDIYLPDDASLAPYPTLFLVHGGGYVVGSEDTLRDAAQYFASQGYAVVAPTYRLAPDFTFPAQIEDVFCALAWTIAHAEDYAFDTERLVLVGESAGGNAVALLGTVDTPDNYLATCEYTLPTDFSPRAVVSYYMPVDLSTCTCESARRMGASYLGVPEFTDDNAEELQMIWAEASPLAYLDVNDPPFLLVHGDMDSLVPMSESKYFLMRALEIGHDSQLSIIPDGQHGFLSFFNIPANQTAMPIVEAFLNAVLNN